MRSDRSQALDHVVLVLFENRSFDNLLGHLYRPDDALKRYRNADSEVSIGRIRRDRQPAALHGKQYFFDLVPIWNVSRDEPRALGQP